MRRRSVLALAMLAAGLNSQKVRAATSRIRIPGERWPIDAMRALPAGRPPAGVLVVHSEAGLDEGVSVWCERLVGAGYAVLAPDLFASVGGSQAVSANKQLFEQVNDVQILRNLDLAFAYLETLLGPDERIGILGIGWGGQKAMLYAMENPDVAAVAVFDAPTPDPAERLLNLDSPLLGNFAARDPAVGKSVGTLEAVLKKAGKRFDFKLYPDAQAAAAAQDAWERTLVFFKQELRV